MFIDGNQFAGETVEIPSIRVLFVTSQWPTRDNPSMAPFVKREVEALIEQGLYIDVFIYKGGWKIGNYFRAIRELWRLVNTRHIDIVHARFGQCGIVARAQWQIPVVISYGGSDIEGSPVFSGWSRYKNYLLRSVSWVLSLLVDEVIVVSDHLGKKLPRKDYHVISSGIDFSLFRPIPKEEARQYLDLDQEKKYLLFAGNPANSRKRYELAQKASLIAAEYIPHELIVLTGQPQDVVPIYMSACDALLLTSTNEGSPNVIKEAIACNLPIVSVKVGDIETRLSGIDGCYLCLDESEESIAVEIQKALNYGLRIDGLVNHAPDSMEKMAQKMITVFKSAMKTEIDVG